MNHNAEMYAECLFDLVLQKLVKLMDGQLTVTSNAGEGSVFEFTLPLGLPEPTAGSALSCCSKPTWPPVQDEKLNGMRVVLVDSHPVRQVKSLFVYFIAYEV